MKKIMQCSFANSGDHLASCYKRKLVEKRHRQYMLSRMCRRSQVGTTQLGKVRLGKVGYGFYNKPIIWMFHRGNEAFRTLI